MCVITNPPFGSISYKRLLAHHIDKFKSFLMISHAIIIQAVANFDARCGSHCKRLKTRFSNGTEKNRTKKCKNKLKYFAVLGRSGAISLI